MNAQKHTRRAAFIISQFLTALFVLFTTTQSHAQTFDQETKLIAPDAVLNGFFGSTVAIDGDTAAVASLAGGVFGSVYIYTLVGTNWVFTQKITDPIEGQVNIFGSSLDLENDELIVGQPAPFDALNISGQAYIYRRVGNNWVLEQSLFETNPPPIDLFGTAVAINGQTAAVSNPQDSSIFLAAGSVSVFNQVGTNWFFQAKLEASDPAKDDLFGRAVAVDGNTILVGSLESDTTGAGYVFVRDGTNWSQQQKLEPADLQPGVQFGLSVALETNIAVIGAHLQPENGVAGGAAYVFVRTGTNWTLQQILAPPNSPGVTNNMEFGVSVSIFNGQIVVGAPGAILNGGIIVPGAVFVYQFNGTSWVLTQTITTANATPDSTFGRSVDIAEPGIIAGAPLDSSVIEGAGAAFIYSRTTAPHIETATASPNVLFPPNHKLVPVTITVTSSDGAFENCRIISVTSSERPKGGKKNEPDFIITGDLTLLLRAERSGQSKQGRIYTITIECVDAQGTVSRTNVTVTVPHDARGVKEEKAVIVDVKGNSKNKGKGNSSKP